MGLTVKWSKCCKLGAKTLEVAGDRLAWGKQIQKKVLI